MKAIVTGHSRGLGAAIAAELMRRDIVVMGLARQRNERLQQEFPSLLCQQQIDLADGMALARWLEGQVLADFLAGDESLLLINNAGTVQPVGALEQLVPSGIARAIALNVSAPLMLSASLAKMTATQQGRECRILHLSSGAGRQAYAGWAVYGASKAALDHHARAAAQDARSGLRICSLAPGVIDTDMQGELRAVAPERFALRELFIALHEQGQLATPAACATRLVGFLLSSGFGQAPTASMG